MPPVRRDRATAADSARSAGAGLPLLWFAHIGMDRALGYGLKYDTDFEGTHLEHIGP